MLLRRLIVQRALDLLQAVAVELLALVHIPLVGDLVGLGQCPAFEIHGCVSNHTSESQATARTVKHTTDV